MAEREDKDKTSRVKLKAKELLEKGNIDTAVRPTVVHPDGSVSTVYTMGTTDKDGKVVNLPMVSDDGRMMTEDEAIQQYQKTGKHLGKFSTPAAADKAAELLHQQQAKQIPKFKKGIPGYDVGFGVPEIQRSPEVTIGEPQMVRSPQHQPLDVSVGEPQMQRSPMVLDTLQATAPAKSDAKPVSIADHARSLINALDAAGVLSKR